MRHSCKAVTQEMALRVYPISVPKKYPYYVDVKGYTRSDAAIVPRHRRIVRKPKDKKQDKKQRSMFDW